MSTNRDDSNTSVGTQKLSVQSDTSPLGLYVADGDTTLTVGVDRDDVSVAVTVDRDRDVDEIEDAVDDLLKEIKHVHALDPTLGDREDLIDTDDRQRDLSWEVVE